MDFSLQLFDHKVFSEAQYHINHIDPSHNCGSFPFKDERLDFFSFIVT